MPKREKGVLWDALLSLVSRGLLGYRIHRNLPAGLVVTLELHDAVLQGKQRIVAAPAHIVAGMDMRTTLANQDVSSQNELAITSVSYTHL